MCVCFFWGGGVGGRLWKLECTQKVNFSSQKSSADGGSMGMCVYTHTLTHIHTHGT